MSKTKKIIAASLVLAMTLVAGYRIHKYRYNNVSLAKPGACLRLTDGKLSAVVKVVANDDASHSSVVEVSFPISDEISIGVEVTAKYSELRDLKAKEVPCEKAD